MRLAIIGIGPALERAVDHIIRLFLEDPEVVFDRGREGAEPFAPPAGGEWGAVVRVQVRREGGAGWRVRVELEAGEHRGAAEEQGVSDGAADGGKRAERLAVSRALVRVLTAWTGIEQPWGVLTGVRPTKLVHRLRSEGAGEERIRSELREELLVGEKKIALLNRIVDRQLEAIPDLYHLKHSVSLYIGIPFCPTKCAYCTFPAYAIGGRQGSVDSFLGGLHHEMRETGRWLAENGIGITTIYFGGGTPTSIAAEEMDMLYEAMYEAFPGMGDVRELTVEAGRPDTITPEKLEVLKRWGIGRISINPQSYRQETLDAIGRHHTVEETIEKFRLARSMGMDNINMDLIIGLPGETPDDFARTLEHTASLMPESLTVHTLSFKRASEMTRNKDAYRVAGRDEIHAMMGMAERWTEANGYEPYYLYRQKNMLGNLENVGYALPGRESLYNILMMEELQSVVALGCGAVSKWVDPATGEIGRYANPKEPKAYNDTFEKHTQAKLEELERLFAGRKQLA